VSRSGDVYAGSDRPGEASQWSTRDQEREPSRPQTVIVRPPNVLIGFRRYCLSCGVALDEGPACGACAAWKAGR
jgi:hypothetical protein